MDDKGPVFELKMIGRLNPAKLRQTDDATLTQRREDRETGRRLATQYAEEALLRLVSLMRTEQDPNVVMRAAKMIMDRAWGQTKALTEEEKKGADAGSILDVLASVSANMSAIERGHEEAPAIEHTTIDNDQDAEDFFQALERSKLDDVADGVLVSD